MNFETFFGQTSDKLEKIEQNLSEVLAKTLSIPIGEEDGLGLELFENEPIGEIDEELIKFMISSSIEYYNTTIAGEGEEVFISQEYIDFEYLDSTLIITIYFLTADMVATPELIEEIPTIQFEY